MSTHRLIDRVCIIITVLAVLLTALFMNGTKLGISADDSVSQGYEDKLFDDSYVRKTAIKARIPYITTMAAAKAAADGIYTVIKEGEIGVM